MTWTRLLLPILLASTVILTPAQAQFEVFDPSNFAQNLQTAANTLTVINNQILGLQNQAQSLINQAKNLTNLPLSTLDQLQTQIGQTSQLLNQARGVAYSVQQVQEAFSGAFAPATMDQSDQSLVAQAQARWQASVGAFEDALETQATVVGNLPGSAAALTDLVTASQSASGALQAAQAGNQLLALQSQQLSDVIALLSSNGRAQALEAARQASDADSAREAFRRFALPQSYTPQGVSMYPR